MNIAVLGTGIIGTALAKRLLIFKHRVIVFNRTLAKTAEVEGLGAKVARTAKSAIQEAEVILITLADVKAIEDVLFSDETEFTDKTFIQMGTIAPDETIELQKKIYTRGGQYLECPILGSKKEALAGELILMAGTTEEKFKKWYELLKCFGPNPRLIGELGKASAFKLALNYLIASHASAFSLSLGIIEKNNIDPADFMSVLKESSLYAPMFEKKLPNWRERKYDDTNFPTKLLLKDIKLIIKEAERLGLNAQMASAIEQSLQKAVEAGLANKDYSSIFNIINNIPTKP